MKHIIEVVTLKELPGIPKGTVLRKPTGGGCQSDFMTPECIDAEGKYIVSKGYLHKSEWEVKDHPEFYKLVSCGCTCCKCMGCECKCS